MFNAELTVACGSRGAFAYQFRTFDQEGEPANLRQSGMRGVEGTGKLVQVRLDGGDVLNRWDFSTRYSNQLLLAGQGVEDIGAAGKVTVRVDLLNGVETYAIDQTASPFREAVTNCVSSAGARAAEPNGDV